MYTDCTLLDFYSCWHIKDATDVSPMHTTLLEFTDSLAVALSYILLPYLQMYGLNLDTDVICDFTLIYPH